MEARWMADQHPSSQPLLPRSTRLTRGSLHGNGSISGYPMGAHHSAELPRALRPGAAVGKNYAARADGGWRGDRGATSVAPPQCKKTSARASGCAVGVYP